MKLETANIDMRRQHLDMLVRELLANPDNFTYGKEDEKMLRTCRENGVKEWMRQGLTMLGMGRAMTIIWMGR
jgi:hypothetical protein